MTTRHVVESNRRTLVLPDDRELAWTSCGDRHGLPVLYCHGFPSSGREVLFADSEARRQGICLLAPDRPGYGGSSPHPGRLITDWPHDVAALLTHVGVDHAPVFAVSGGAPYALACAACLPARFTAVVTAGGLGPLWRPEALAGMSTISRVAGLFAARLPGLQAGMFHAIGALLRLWPGAILGLVAAGLPASERRLFRDRPLRRIWQAALQAALCNGAGAAIEEFRLYGRQWGFQLPDIGVPVRIWHGGADTIVPPAHARLLAGELAHAELRWRPDAGHFSIVVNHVRDILEDVIDAANPPVT